MSQTHVEPDRGSTTSRPRRVKVFGIIVLVLLFGILRLTGDSLGGPGGHTPPIEHGVKQP